MTLGVELVSCDLLREGAPIEPVPPVTHWKPEAVVSAKHKVLLSPSEGIITHLKSVSPHVLIVFVCWVSVDDAGHNRTHCECYCGRTKPTMKPSQISSTSIKRSFCFGYFSAGHPKAWCLKLFDEECWVWFCHGCALESFLSSCGWLWNSCAGSSSTTRTAHGSRQRSAGTSTELTLSRRRTATRLSSVMLMSSAILCAGLCSLATQSSLFILIFFVQLKAFMKTINSLTIKKMQS